MRFGPVAFLLIVPTGWAVVRSVMLWPDAAASPDRPIAYAPVLSRGPAILPPPIAQVSADIETSSLRPPAGSPQRFLRATGGASSAVSPVEVVASSSFVTEPQAAPDQLFVSSAPSPTVHAAQSQRFDLSAWAIVRGDVGPGLATAGQLGGSQAGVRARYRLNEHLHLAVRLSGPIRSRLGKEAAIALDVRPVVNVPIAVTVERRIGLDRGGRDAFAIGLVGGFDHALMPSLRLDGYAQAGVVGLTRRDAYVDGMIRLEQRVSGRDRARFGIGAGVWGGAQPGASRLDVGPQIVARFPIGSGGVRLGVEWRQRVAGDARPGSGPVASLGADF